jgi:hypothetical protein
MGEKETERADEPGSARNLALAQGAFFVASGAWPLVAMPTFEMATGRKKEPWLVKTVGLLLVATGVTLIRRRRDNPATLAAFARAPLLALAGIDIWYAGVRDVISRVYLVDLAMQAGWLAAWSAALRSKKARPIRPRSDFH